MSGDPDAVYDDAFGRCEAGTAEACYWLYAEGFVDDSVEVVDIGEVAVSEFSGDGLAEGWADGVQEFLANVGVLGEVVEYPGHGYRAGVTRGLVVVINCPAGHSARQTTHVAAISTASASVHRSYLLKKDLGSFDL